MRPIDQARLVYEQEPCARTFEEDLRLHLMHGYVFSTPEIFMMGRGVRRDAPDYDILNPTVTWPEDLCDTWMIYLAAGNIGDFFRFEPTPKKWVAFERENQLRVHSYDRIKRLAHRRPWIISTSTHRSSASPGEEKHPSP